MTIPHKAALEQFRMVKKSLLPPSQSLDSIRPTHSEEALIMLLARVVARVKVLEAWKHKIEQKGQTE